MMISFLHKVLCVCIFFVTFAANLMKNNQVVFTHNKEKEP